MTETPHISRSICALPWSHIATTIDGVWSRCCFDNTNDYDEYYYVSEEPRFALHPDAIGCAPNSRFAVDNPAKVFNLFDAFNSPAMRETRREMLRGEQPAACSHCYQRENEGLRSHRMAVTEIIESSVLGQFVAKTLPDGAVEHQPTYLDLRFGNSCNLNCIMCGFPTTSRDGASAPAWARQLIDPFRDDSEFWEQLEQWAPGLQIIYFAGGEPFLQRGHDRTLELLLRIGVAPNIELRYNSNMTVRPKVGFAALAAFKRVEISASCDGVGETFEEIRQGGRWTDFVRNVSEARQYVNVLLDVTIQRTNIAAIGDIIDYARNEDLPLRLENFVDDPPEHSIRSLPTGQIDAIESTIHSLSKTATECGEHQLAAQLDAIVVYVRAT